MDTERLSAICAGLGSAKEEDESGAIVGYTKSEICLDNLKDLQRFLRRDNPQRRDVFKQICKWKTVSHDLIPIIEYYQNDRNLVINAVKILVFLTMPVDPNSDDIAQQIEYLWDLKAAMARNVTLAVIISLLEDPLDHLERDAFTEDDWKLVQLVLTLFRNVLAVQDITLQQKASGSATQFLCLTDSFLELLFQENIMDLILVLTQHVDEPSGYLQQDNLLLLEIYHSIFLGRDPELIAKAHKKKSMIDEDISTSVDSLRSIIEEEHETRRIVGLRSLERHSLFSGTFTRQSVDGSRTLFKGNPTSASGNGFLKVHKVQRGPLKRIAWDQGRLSLPKQNILGLLNNFLNQFLSGGYNVLMQSICNDITKEHQSIQNSDIISFFQVADFVLAFQHQKASISKKADMEGPTSETSINNKDVDNSSCHWDLCGSVASTMNEAMFNLVITKWRETFEALKETNDYKPLSAAGSLIKRMIRMIDLVLKLFPEDSKEPQTARVLLYKLFYDQTDQGLTQFLLNLFKSFDTHKQTKSDLADLLEIIHVVLRLMEKLQARGTLRVSKKIRKGRKRKTTKDNGEIKAEKLGEVHASPKDNETNETGLPTSQSFIDSDNLLEQHSSESNFIEKEAADIEGIPITNPVVEPVALLQAGHLMGDSSYMDSEELKRKLVDLADETSDSSTGDQMPSTSEVDFNVSRLIASLANNAVVHNLCWLLKYYRSNSASTNHYIICMLRRFCEDLEMSPMLYQLSVLITFYDILADKKSTSKEHSNVISFLAKLVRKMLVLMKKQPLLFVEILFWKTRKECHYINAEALSCDMASLKKDIRNLDSDANGLSNETGRGQKSIADSLGDDEADLVIPHYPNNPEEESSSDGGEDDLHTTNKIVDQRSSVRSPLGRDPEVGTSDVVSSHFQTMKSSKRRRGSVFNEEQENRIRDLYKRFRDDRRCGHLIAEALDPDGKISSTQVYRKLKQLGLRIATRKKCTSDGPLSATDDPDIVAYDAFPSDYPQNLNEQENGPNLERSLSQRKKRKLLMKDATVTISQRAAALEEHDSDNETLSTLLRSRRKANRSPSNRVESTSHSKETSVDLESVDEIPGSNFEDITVQHESEQCQENGPEAGVNDSLNKSIEAAVDNASNRVQDIAELMDSEDDNDNIAPKRIGLKRHLKMVIDDDDD
ncbi:uncharacterized protein [Typha latifolia]|uniref:uncharacterized protein isoform X1 n=1 Tax=Typha latifolia TaxID=4733 RepID=UPI003C2D84C7